MGGMRYVSPLIALCALLPLVSRAQDVPPVVAPPVEPTPAPSPTPAPEKWHLSIGGPSPAFSQPRGATRPRRTTAQVPVALRGRLLESSPLGTLTLESDNLISSDAFDQSARLGVRLAVEKKVGPLSLIGGIGLLGNQTATTKNLGFDLGTRLPLGLKLGGQSPALDLNFLRFESRGVDPRVSPRHVGKSVFAPSLGLMLPPLFLGKGEGDVTRRPHFLVGARAWYFSNEKAATGFTPEKFASLFDLGFVIPGKALPLKVPGVQGFAISLQSGGNPAANYARINNVRFNFLFTPPGMSALPKSPVAAR
jgi:hypothetical protein